MTNAMDRIGEYRAATTNKGRALVLLGARDLEMWEELYTYATDQDPDVLSPSRLEPWVTWQDKEYDDKTGEWIPGPPRRSYVDQAPGIDWVINLDDHRLFGHDDIDIRDPSYRWRKDNLYRYLTAWLDWSAKHQPSKTTMPDKVLCSFEAAMNARRSMHIPDDWQELYAYTHLNEPGSLIEMLNQIDPDWRSLDPWHESIRDVQMMRTILYLFMESPRVDELASDVTFALRIYYVEKIRGYGQPEHGKDGIASEYTTYVLEDGLKTMIKMACGGTH